MNGKKNYMTFNAGIIGCSGTRFNEIYLPFFLEKKNQKKINFLKVFNRTTLSSVKVAKILESNVSSSIEDILNDKDIDLVFLILPMNIRRDILKNNIDKKKILISEVPIVKNILDYHILIRNLNSKQINLYIFEDRYYFYKKVFNNFLKKPLNKIVLNNIEWMHHAYGAIAAINSKTNLKKVFYIKKKSSDEYLFKYNCFEACYMFKNNKNENVRENGIISLEFHENGSKEFSFSKQEYKALKCQSLDYFFDENEEKFKNFKQDTYLINHLKNEAIFVTIIKIAKFTKFYWFPKFVVNIFITLGVLK